ncbi:hypothetical protein GCM10027344_29800 [Spelaeicoccus albus]
MSGVRHWVRETALTVAAVIGVLCVLMAGAALVFGIKPLVFESGSMGPRIDTGALGVAISTPAHDLHVGDVVSVRDAAGDRVTHRIVGMTRGGNGQAVLTLRGDANTASDAEAYRVVEADRLLFSVNNLGYVVAALQSPAAIFLGGLLVGVLLMVAFRRSDSGGRTARTSGSPAAGPSRRRSRHRGTTRGPARRRGVGSVAAVALLGAVVSLGAPAVHGTKAAYTDTSAATATITATTIGTVKGHCRYNPGLGSGTFVLTWSFVNGGEDYTGANASFAYSKRTGLGLITLTGTNAPTTSKPENGVYTTKIGTGLLSGLLGGDFDFAVTVSDSGWSSPPVKFTASNSLLGGSGDCDANFG